MNHHPTGMPPYGQVPIPPPQRRHDMSYSPMPPNMRPQPYYQGYYHPHMAGPIPQYAPQYAPQWYPHHQMHHQPPPPRTYPSYPPHQIQHAHPHMPVMIPPYASHQSPHTPTNATVLPPQRTTASPSQNHFTPQTNVSSSTPIQSPFSPPPASTPSTANVQPATPPSTSSAVSQSTNDISMSPADPFFPPLPWSSVGDQPFPHKVRRQRRRVMRSQLGFAPVNFPLEEAPAAGEYPPTTEEAQQLVKKNISSGQEDHSSTQEGEKLSEEEKSATPAPSQTPTAQTSEAPSETGSTDLTTPSPAITPQPVKAQPTPIPQTRSTRSVVPVIPAVPILPLSPKTSRQHHRDSVSVVSSTSNPQLESSSNETRRSSTTSILPNTGTSPGVSAETSKPASPPAPPKSWADLVRSKTVSKPTNNAASTSQLAKGLGPAKNETLSDVLNTIDVTATHTAAKLAFLKPRGLVNTGNMCYMNSVLQVLVFCIPFYEFLERVGQRSAHSFKSDTPLIDSIILFMREFPVIDSAESFEQLRLRLKPEELEQYGDAFIPEYVYQVIRQLPRFRDMRRGHQQDAQEFLGFLLEELHEECAQAMRGGTSGNSGTSTPTEKSASIAESADNDAGWMEVGHKQKPAITRSSGAIAMESPVTKIFGGKLRSEWKVPGNKNSVTLEPYQSLQLDIGSPQVKNIVDALKGLTRPESMQGDFNSSRGTKVTATKQVFIETLPPVLILHLKRFQYDNATKRTEKIWKKVGYPLELEMPREVFPTQLRNKLAVHGSLPRYQLIGVIYHHGRNASGGHYTVDVRRQDGKEWIRLDDTLIRRVRSEDVAEGGSEEDPKVLAAALERHNNQQRSSSTQRNNMFEQIEDEDEGRKEEDDGEDGNENAWSQVNGHGHSRSKASNATATVNGVPSPTTSRSGPHTPREKDRYAGVRDDKVAYLLFYRRVAS